jgi:heme exporter protein CcmD
MPNFELGKYAIYIVPAYAIAIVVIAVAVAETLARTRRWKREVERLEALKTSKKKA